MPAQSRRASILSLTKKLSARLSAPLSLDEPFVVEDRIAQTKSRHVLVIWDAWKNLPREDRSRIILDAFQSSHRLDGDTVRLAVGLTQEEAFNMGYLPFQIVAIVRKTDPVSLREVRKALESIGGIHVKEGSLRQVRFPSQQLAEDAYRQLSTKIPGPYWAITREVAAVGQI